MRKTEIQYYYGQDGEIVDPYIKRIFSLGTQDMEYSEEKKADIYNVVGFVYYQEKILTIFPKHYFDVLQLEILNTEKKEIEDIKLLYKVIKKYSENEKTKAAARKYMGPDSAERYDSDYPFSSFYEVYDYYRKFGLYKERTESIKANGNGRVSWKETIRKSQKIISNGNLIFSPLLTIKKNYQDVFLSECMAFVINYTLDCFHSFISLKPVKGTAYKFDYINNIDYVIAKLNESKEQVFKDIHKKLVQSLIDFFVQYRNLSRSGRIQMKIRHFNMIWQTMMGNYLNHHFVGMDSIGEQALFDMGISNSPIEFKNVRFDDVDKSPHAFYIDVDHIAYEDKKLYIFDSKYYSSNKHLNYKQLAYNELLRHHYSDVQQISNVLLLPGKVGSGIHFEFGDAYVGDRVIGTKIVEQFFEPEWIMRDYIED